MVFFSTSEYASSAGLTATFQHKSFTASQGSVREIYSSMAELILLFLFMIDNAFC